MKWNIITNKLGYWEWKPYYNRRSLIWKDKFGTPRVELIPSIIFQWLWFEIYATKGTYQYWEQWLWIYKYNNGDINKAKQSWGWDKWEKYNYEK